MPEFKKYALQGIFTQHQRELRAVDRDLLILLEEVLTNLGYLLNRGLTFADNHETAVIEYTSNAVADTEDTVAHDLGKVPTGFFVINRDKSGVVYAGPTPFTATQLFLKCTTTSTAIKLIVF